MSVIAMAKTRFSLWVQLMGASGWSLRKIGGRFWSQLLIAIAN